MNSGIAIALMLVAMSAFLAWLMRARRDDDAPSATDDIDYEQLREAEEEVQDLDAFTSPDDADEELRDWGPGTPR